MNQPAPYFGGPLDGAFADSDRWVFRHGDGTAAIGNDRWRPSDENGIYVRPGPRGGDGYRWIITPTPPGAPAPYRRVTA